MLRGVYIFDSRTVTEPTYRGALADFGIKVCFADVDGLAVEIMQPLFAPSIFQEYLELHGESIHHFAFDIGQFPWADRLAAFADRGFPVSQMGQFGEHNSLAFFDTEQATGTTFETHIHIRLRLD